MEQFVNILIINCLSSFCCIIYTIVIRLLLYLQIKRSSNLFNNKFVLLQGRILSIAETLTKPQNLTSEVLFFYSFCQLNTLASARILFFVVHRSVNCKLRLLRNCLKRSCLDIKSDGGSCLFW